MAEESERRCDVDDILCQMQILSHLKGLESAMGEETFKTSFPELEGLGQTVMERINQQDSSLKEALEKCGFPSLEVEPEIIVEPETAI